MNIWNFIKADPFFANYLPYIKSYKYKIRGTNSRNNPIDFSDKEKKEIKDGIKRMIKDTLG